MIFDFTSFYPDLLALLYFTARVVLIGCDKAYNGFIALQCMYNELLVFQRPWYNVHKCLPFKTYSSFHF